MLLLVVRELMLGPRRFTDLMDGLPGISANVLSSRLKDLEEEGLVSKRTLPAPAASAVYELTDRALGLARCSRLWPTGEWACSAGPAKATRVRGAWVVLGIAVTTPVPDVDDATYEFRVDGDMLQVHVRNGRLQPRHGTASDPAAVITVGATTLVDLAFSRLELDDALARGRITVAGNQAAGRRLLESINRTRAAITSI